MKSKKISLRGLSKILNEKELKNVLGGCGGDDDGKKCTRNCIGGMISIPCQYGECEDDESNFMTKCVVSSPADGGGHIICQTND